MDVNSICIAQVFLTLLYCSQWHIHSSYMFVQIEQSKMLVCLKDLLSIYPSIYSDKCDLDSQMMLQGLKHDQDSSLNLLVGRNTKFIFT